ncbi:MAG: flagellar hook-basal body complex protein [Bacillota bacterium]|nr:flagellar hook-basal body complex protein [Bacillota bacterium]
MIRGIKNAASALQAQQQRMDVISHNIANVNTTAFKKKEVVFGDLLYQSVERRGNAVDFSGAGQKEITSGNGVYTAAVRTRPEQGFFRETGNMFDLAIAGEGYFCLLLPDGRQAYTRDGSFRLDNERRLVSPQGYRLVFPALPAEDFELVIGSKGQITLHTVSGDTIDLRQLELAYFDNPAGLENAGENLLLETAASGPARIGPPAEGTEIRQGWLENSNVELAEEMIALVRSQRNYQLNASALRTLDEMLEIANYISR